MQAFLMKSRTLMLALVLVASTLIAVSAPTIAYAQETGDTTLQIISAVEAAAALGVVTGSLIKLADSWYKTPDNVDFDRRNHGALVISVGLAIILGLAAYSQFNIPSDTQSLFAVFAINIPTGIGLQWVTNRGLQGFFVTTPQTDSGGAATGNPPAR